jgi:hypothetical protein
MGDNRGTGRLLELMAEHDDFQTLVSFMPSPGWQGPGKPGSGGREKGSRGPKSGKNGDGSLDIDAIMKQSLHRKTDKPVVMLSGGGPRMSGSEDGADLVEQIRKTLFDDGVATFSTMTRLANALGKVTDFYDYRRKWAEFP